VESRRTLAEDGRAAVPGPDRRPTARRARRAATAIACAAFGLLVAPAGCLNPRPEEDPSFGGNADSAPEAPVAQSCDQNPALSTCVRSPVDVENGNGVDDADEASSPDAPSGSPGADQPSVADAGSSADAGSDTDGSDTDGPDAGVGVAP
jgi:hypothetical protein